MPLRNSVYSGPLRGIALGGSTLEDDDGLNPGGSREKEEEDSLNPGGSLVREEGRSLKNSGRRGEGEDSLNNGRSRDVHNNLMDCVPENDRCNADGSDMESDCREFQRVGGKVCWYRMEDHRVDLRFHRTNRHYHPLWKHSFPGPHYYPSQPHLYCALIPSLSMRRFQQNTFPCRSSLSGCKAPFLQVKFCATFDLALSRCLCSSFLGVALSLCFFYLANSAERRSLVSLVRRDFSLFFYREPAMDQYI